MTDLPYSTITVSGDDAFDFLQAQLAADLSRLGSNTQLSRRHTDQRNRVASTEPILSAWCNPKGRVICLLRVAKAGETYMLTLPAELADEVVRRLTMYRFRAKVEFAVEMATAEQLGMKNSYDEWRIGNLRAGIPEILQAQSEVFTPHMLNLDLLGAVSIDKGCYPGQEIVSRTHYRGATKRRCLRFESADPVSPGDKVSDSDRAVGDVVNAIGNDLLAVVPVDKSGAELTISGVSLRHVLIEYLRPHMRE